jgi:hypothetical protein
VYPGDMDMVVVIVIGQKARGDGSEPGGMWECGSSD